MNLRRLAVTCLLPAAACPMPAAVLVLDSTTDLPLVRGFPLDFVQGVLGFPEL